MAPSIELAMRGDICAGDLAPDMPRMHTCIYEPFPDP